VKAVAPASAPEAAERQQPEHCRTQAEARTPARTRAGSAAARVAHGRRDCELLCGEDVVGLGDPARIVGQDDRAVCELRVRRGHGERLGGEDVVGGLFGGRF
jgi:hypothetical protein